MLQRIPQWMRSTYLNVITRHRLLTRINQCGLQLESVGRRLIQRPHVSGRDSAWKVNNKPVLYTWLKNQVAISFVKQPNIFNTWII
ncbi:hypothetical protein WJ21_18575 [Burkholderia vietnamiensis]|nr:hypothetical protein WJ21_18575 [Burkholderia vietnamiensis]